MNAVLTPTGSDDTQLLRDTFARVEPYSTITLSGQFRVAGDVECRQSNVTVLGYGSLLTQLAEHCKTLSLVGCNNARLIGLSLCGCGTEKPWQQYATPYNGVAAIHLATASGVLVRDCQIVNHAGGSVVLDGRCTDIKIIDNTISGMGAEYIKPLDNGYDAAVAGTANSIAKSFVTLRGNNISGHAFGLLIPGNCSMVVDGNHIHDIPGQHGAYLMRGGHLAFTTNIIQRCIGVGMKLQHQTPEHLDSVVNVSHNTVSECGSLAIGILTVGAGVGFTQCNVSVMSNNTAKCEYPLYLRGLRDALVCHNRGRDCRRSFYKADCDGLFADNYFVNCGA